MMEGIRRCWSAVLRAAGLRAPSGHLKGLRNIVATRENERVAREAENEERRTGRAGGSAATAASPDAPDDRDETDAHDRVE
jgi:hypothetical protein